MGPVISSVHPIRVAVPTQTYGPVQVFGPWAPPLVYPGGTNGGGGSSDGGDTVPSTLPDSASLFTAACVVTDLVGNLVYARNDGSVRTADSYYPYIVVGVIVSKTSDTACVVQKYGPVEGAFTHLTPGRAYYVGAQGNVTAAPFPSYAVKFVQLVGQATSPTTLFLQPSGTVLRRNVDNTQVGD